MKGTYTERIKDVRNIIKVLLFDQYRTKYPTIPETEVLSIAKTKKVKDSNSNELTKSIILLIDLLGGFATRQQSQGQYNAALGRYTKSTTKRGVTDITGLLNGKPLNIEVKHGNDKQSDDQKKVEQQITQAGGLYYIAKNLPDTFDFIISNYSVPPETILNLRERAKTLLTKPKKAA